MRARIRRLLQAGFSVLELLVSVAVVAVLAALVFPAVKGTMENAQSAGCVSNLRQIGSALIAFAGDHEGYLPRTVYFDSDGYPNEYWTTRIKSYLGIANPDLQVGQNILRCPARGPFNPENGENYTYGLNYGKASAVDGNYYDFGRVQPLVRLGNKVYLMSDSFGLYVPIVMWPGSNGYWPLMQDKNHDGIADTAPGEAADYNCIKFIHHRETAANFLFGDGSVRMYTIRQWSENEDGLWGEPWEQ